MLKACHPVKIQVRIFLMRHINFLGNDKLHKRLNQKYKITAISAVNKNLNVSDY